MATTVRELGGAGAAVNTPVPVADPPTKPLTPPTETVKPPADVRFPPPNTPTSPNPNIDNRGGTDAVTGHNVADGKKPIPPDGTAGANGANTTTTAGGGHRTGGGTADTRGGGGGMGGNLGTGNGARAGGGGGAGNGGGGFGGGFTNAGINTGTGAFANGGGITRDAANHFIPTTGQATTPTVPGQGNPNHQNGQANPNGTPNPVPNGQTGVVQAPWRPGPGTPQHMQAAPGGVPLPNTFAANPLPGATYPGHAPMTAAQLIAPATALAGTATTITQNGAFNQPIRGGVANTPPNINQPAPPVAQVPTAMPAAGSPVRGAVQAVPQVAAGLADPRAQAAVAATQGPGAATVAPVGPNAAALRAGLAQQVAAAQAAGAQPLAGQAGASARGVPSSAQAAALALAQAALAQTLGRVTSGQMTAGGAAMALAEAQLALRASRLAQAQAQMLMPTAATGQRGMATPLAAGAGRGAAQAMNMSAAPQGVAQGVAAAQRAAANSAGALQGASARAGAQATPAQAQTPRAGELPQGAAKAAQKQGELGSAATMPQKLAMALAMAPKLRKRGSHDRVEKVDRFTPRAQTPEMEDEDFWDGSEDEGDEGFDQTADSGHAAENAADAAVQHYRALHLWLQANDQPALLRELGLGRRVLVLAPPDKTHLRLVGHVLWPDAADTVHAAGAKGRAWPLAARWEATLPADGQWRHWRLRQWVDAEGDWHVGASQPDRHTPRVLLADDPNAGTLPTVGEYITVAEPRRLRRLMGQQWTMMALRVPVPLDGMGAQGAAVAGAR